MKVTTKEIKEYYYNKVAEKAIFKDTDIDRYEMKENARKIKEERSIENIVNLSDIVENILK